MAQEKFSPAKQERKPGPIALTKDEEIPCRLCKKPTPMLGTKLCDGCWELETRIHRDPEIAIKILNEIRPESSTDTFWSLMQRLDSKHS